MSCLFSRDIAFDCTDVQQGGVVARVILINHTDWIASTVTVDATSKEITDITLAAGGIEGYEIQVPRGSMVIPSVAKREVEGVDQFDHSVQLKINSIEQLDVDAISQLVAGKVVCIVELSEGRSRVYGGFVVDPSGTPVPGGTGLNLGEYNDLLSDPGTGGNIDFTLVTDARDAGQAKPPYLIASSFDIDDLLTPTA